MYNQAERLIILIIMLSIILMPTKVEAKSYKLTKKEEKLIQRIMYLEAGGHGIKGMTLVGRTIMNRVSSKRFPNSVTKVIYAKNQFVTAKYAHKGKINKKTKKALKNIKNGKYRNMKALYFCEKSSYRGWWKTLKVVYRHKSHVYCK